MHDLNSEICLDARADFGWIRARARAACRQPARLLISRARWLLNARHVTKTDALIEFLSEFWVFGEQSPLPLSVTCHGAPRSAHDLARWLVRSLL